MKLLIDNLDWKFRNKRTISSINLQYLIEDKFIVELYNNTLSIFKR